MQNKFKEIYQNSINNPKKFWEEASKDIFWFKEPTKILNKSNPLSINGLRMVLQTLVTTL